MIVIPIRVGYYAYGDDPWNHQRRYPAEYAHKPNAGASFELVKPEHFSPTWMEIVEATPEERAIAEKKKKVTGTIVMDAFGAPPAAPGVKVKNSTGDQLAKEHEAEAKRRKNKKKGAVTEIKAKEKEEAPKSSGDEEVL